MEKSSPAIRLEKSTSCSSLTTITLLHFSDMDCPRSIGEAHALLRAKKISARELLSCTIDAIDKRNPQINAFVADRRSEALHDAEKIDHVGDFSHPLTGIPFATKDVYCEAGVPTTACSNILRDKTFVPAYESTTTKRLKAKGAISIGKTNTDEFTMGSSTETSYYGTTRNPWDVNYTAGGSSGGSAAAVAAGMAVFSLGTDTGGSIRLPAAYCGITGLRPTYGRVSRFGVMSMASSLDVIGPMCSTAKDLAIVLQAIAGKDSLDATTADLPVPDYTAALTGDIRGLRVGIPKEYFIDGMNNEVESAVRSSAKIYEGLGAVVKEISLPHTKYATPCYYVLCPSEVSSNMSRYDGVRYGHSVEHPENLLEYYLKVRSTGFGPEVKRRIMIGTYALSAGYFDAYYRQAQKVRTLIKRDFDEAFREVDIILSPTTPTPPFRIGAHANDPIAMYLEDVFLDGQVMAGIPCLSINCGWTKKTADTPALPIGLQIMGPQWGEEVILRAAEAWERTMAK